MKVYLLLVPFSFFIFSVSSASLATIPTEFVVRCGVTEGLSTLKLSKRLDSVFTCKRGRPPYDTTGSTISGQGILAVTIGSNVFSEARLDGEFFSEDSCENVKNIQLVVRDSEIGVYYYLVIRGDDIKMYQDGHSSLVCVGQKK